MSIFARRGLPDNRPAPQDRTPEGRHSTRGQGSARSSKALTQSLFEALTAVLLAFAAVTLAHWPLLRLPYYWDEAGYYIPAAYDFFRRGTLIPYSTLSNAHPPLPSLYLAAWWRLFGFSPLVTRLAMCLVASLALAAVYRLATLLMQDRRAAAATALLTAIYPVWFVQSTLAHADLLAASGTLWGLCLFFAARQADGPGEAPSAPASDLSHRSTAATLADGKLLMIGASGCFALAALSKEIAIGTPLALAAWELWLPARGPRRGSRPRETRPGPRASRKHLQAAAWLTAPALPLAAWFGYHRWRTGFLFGNPEYLRYNATATLSPLRVALALVHRGLHLTAHLNLFVPVLVTLGCLLLPRLPAPQALARPEMTRENRACLFVVIGVNWIFFSVLGGALLTRYLLPLYPLVLLLCVDAWRQRLRHWLPLAALTAAAFLLGLFVNPPYRFAPEDTLAYRDSILLEQHAIAQIETRYGKPTVLTAWPASDALTKPELGYVQEPLAVIPIDNFSYAQIKQAQALASKEGSNGQPYTVALLFSTKYEAPGPLLRLEGRLGEQNRAIDERFFDFHQDLPPAAVARLLGGAVVWQEQRRGQWAAVVHFDRPQLALARTPPLLPPWASRRTRQQLSPPATRCDSLFSDSL